MEIEKDINRLKDITELLKDEIKSNDRNSFATMDIEDLISLDNLIKYVEANKC